MAFHLTPAQRLAAAKKAAATRRLHAHATASKHAKLTAATHRGKKAAMQRLNIAKMDAMARLSTY